MNFLKLPNVSNALRHPDGNGSMALLFLSIYSQRTVISLERRGAVCLWNTAQSRHVKVKVFSVEVKDLPLLVNRASSKEISLDGHF